MEVQIKSLANNPNVQTAALSVIFLNGVFHLAFGANYIDKGNPFQTLTLPSLFASNKGVKGVGGFSIIAGLYLMAAPVAIYWNLNRNKMNHKMSNASWLVTVIAILFNFTAAVLSAQIYTPVARYLAREGLSVSDLINYYRDMLNFALANSILAFILGLTSSVILLISANYHRTKVGIQNSIDEVTEHKEEGAHNDTNEEATGNFGRSSPPLRSVDFEKEDYRDEEKRAEKMGNQLEGPELKEQQQYDRRQNKLQLDPNSRHTYVPYSSPSLQVESPFQPRRSLDNKIAAQLPQAAIKRTFIA